VAFNPYEETYCKSIQILKSGPSFAPLFLISSLTLHLANREQLRRIHSQSGCNADVLCSPGTEIISRSGTVWSRLHYTDLHANARLARSSANTSGAARKSAHAPCRSFPTSVLLSARVTLEPRSKLDPPLDHPPFSLRGLQRDFRSIDVDIRISQQVSIQIKASVSRWTKSREERASELFAGSSSLSRSLDRRAPIREFPSKCTGCCWRVCNISCRSVKCVGIVRLAFCMLGQFGTRISELVDLTLIDILFSFFSFLPSSPFPPSHLKVSNFLLHRKFFSDRDAYICT